MHILAFGRLQDLGYLGPPGVLHDPAKAMQPNMSLSQMVVAIDPLP